MAVQLLYFAGLREALGRPGEVVELPEGVRSVATLRSHLDARGAPWSLLASCGLCFAVNGALARSADEPISDGDEIAIFSGVTGG